MTSARTPSSPWLAEVTRAPLSDRDSGRIDELLDALNAMAPLSAHGVFHLAYRILA